LCPFFDTVHQPLGQYTNCNIRTFL